MEKCECEHCVGIELGRRIQEAKERLQKNDLKEEITKILGEVYRATKPIITMKHSPSKECLKVLSKHGMMLEKTDVKSGEDTRWNVKFI